MAEPIVSRGIENIFCRRNEQAAKYDERRIPLRCENQEDEYNPVKGRVEGKERRGIKSAIKTKLGNREFSSRLSSIREHVQSFRVNLTRNADSRRRFPRNFASTDSFRYFDPSLFPPFPNGRS